MNKKQTIIKGAIFLFLGKVSNLLVSALQILLIPRLLGPKNMGVYSYWLSVYFIVARILGLGGQHIIIRYTPELKIKNKYMIPTLIKKVIYMKFPLFIFIICLGFLFWTHEFSYFLIITVAALLFSLNLAGESILYSYNRMGPYALIPIIRLASRTILVIALFYLLYTTGIILGLFGAPVIALLLTLFLSLRLLPRKNVALDQPFKKYFSFGFWIYISEAIQGMIIWLITILSKIHIKDMAVVGFFGVGVQICFSLIILIFFINESILPSLVEFHVTKNSKFKESLKLAWKYTNIFLFPLILGGFVLTRPIIAFVIGKDYLAGTLIIKLFFPAIIFFSWIRFHSQILFVYDKKIKIFLTQIINLLVFLGSWFYFIKIKEINLAPLSLCLGGLTAYFFILIQSYKIEKVKSYAGNFLKPLAAASIMALIVNFFTIHSIFQLLLVVLLGLLIYGILLLLLRGIGKDDLKILKEFLGSVKIFGGEIDI